MATPPYTVKNTVKSLVVWRDFPYNRLPTPPALPYSAAPARPAFPPQECRHE
ncbi:MAG: hypothetical protein RBR03_09740 [Desulfuromonas thiophila]|nr:hypothetical protein [Desulfuromonas thiophila]